MSSRSNQFGPAVRAFIPDRAATLPMFDSIELETDVIRRHSVAFVRATVSNGRVTRQLVRLEPRFDGPVWAPRAGRGGGLEWTADEWRGVVEPGRTRGFGFATPDDPPADPLEVTAATRVSDSDGDPLPSETVLDALESGSPAGVPPATPADG